MKAERRHELKTNALARGLEAMPFYLQQHGAKILGVLVVAILVFALLRYRASSERQNLQMAGESLSQARAVIAELQDLGGYGTTSVPEIARSARQALDNIPPATDDPTILAETLVARGDLNWALANRIERPEAATQPSERIEESSDELLQRAENAYKEVLAKYPAQTLAVASARFGLAAIAENRGDWEAAGQQYEAVRDDETLGQAFTEQAKLRLENLDEIKNPMLIIATTRPAAESPTTVPTTLPADLSGTIERPAPTTAPTAAPATTQPAP